MEYTDFLEVWAQTPESALAMFGLSAEHYHIVILKEGPETERERGQYVADAKLFGLRPKAVAST